MGRRLGLLGLLIALTGCAPGPPPAASYRGTAQTVCSPVDASGYELQLTRVSGTGPAELRLILWGSAAAGRGPVRLTGGVNSGELRLCQAADCKPAAGAAVEFASGDAGIMAGTIRWRTGLSVNTAQFLATVEQTLAPPICG